MKKFRWFMAAALIFLLAACSNNTDDGQSINHGSVNDGEAANGYGAIDHGIDDRQEDDDKKVGFSLTGETIEEAAGVPAEEKGKILEAFNIYIEAFNNKDVDKYLDTLSDQTESFDKEEERAYIEEVFNDFDTHREASDVTIVKYSETEAQVFAKLQMSMKQIATGLETNPSGRQVTVFTKDGGEWKVASIHYIGDTEGE